MATANSVSPRMSTPPSVSSTGVWLCSSALLYVCRRWKVTGVLVVMDNNGWVDSVVGRWWGAEVARWWGAEVARWVRGGSVAVAVAVLHVGHGCCWAITVPLDESRSVKSSLPSRISI